MEKLDILPLITPCCFFHFRLGRIVTILVKNKNFISAAIVIFFSCSLHAQKNILPSDPTASTETINLYRNLNRVSKKGFLFGHQDDLAYGVYWKYKKDSSDVKSVSGDYPALYGWELCGLESDHPDNIDGVPFEKMRDFIKEGYARGGVITISWHAPNPIGIGKNAWDTTHGAVASVLPGGINHRLFKEWIDKVAAFLVSLKGSNGEQIPILLRPFHELTGTWFWWCRNTCSPGEFKSLWQFTINYLREEKKLHNLLIVYNTSGGFETAADFLDRYPGDDMVDVLSFDTYQYDNPEKTYAFEKNTNKELGIIEQVAKEKGKLFALAETGYEAIPYASWWTDKLMKAIGDHKIAYVLVWRNKGYHEAMKRMHYYVPFKGDKSEADFVKFYNLDNTLFEKDARKEKLYR